MKHTRLIIIALSIIAVAVGVFLLFNTSDVVAPQATIDSKPQQTERVTKLIIGPATAPVTVVEYFDYKCPNCNSFHRTVAKDIEREYIDSDRAKFEIRIIPIIAPDSRRAGIGAYCANEQGQFTTYHNTVLDYLWDNYYEARDFSKEFDDILTTDLVSSLITDTEINTEELVACIESGKYNEVLDANLELARTDEIQGTPGFAIGEQTFVGSQPFRVFKTLLDIELSAL